MDAAFYCMSSEAYFLGAVGLVNSLRLVGHTEPIYMLDCGLDPGHRELLEPHVIVVDAPTEPEPFLFKTVAPRRHPADTMVLIDADMVATRSLDPLIEDARSAGVAAVKDRLDRFAPEWGELLDLGTARRTPYVSSGLIVLGGETGHDVLELMDDRQHRVDFERSYFGASPEPGYAFHYLDQDVLNAVIATRVGPERFEPIDERLAPTPPYRGIRVDEATLRCAYRDGTEPYVLHQFVRKPWLEPMYHGPYSRLLARLLLADDVAIRVPSDEVPRRMRDGVAARLERRRVDVVDLVRWYARDVIPDWIAERRGKPRGGPGADG